MLKGYIEGMGKHTAPMPMRVFMGKCPQKEGLPVVGRLIFEEAIDVSSGNEAFLAVIREGHGAELYQDPRIVGVIRLWEDAEENRSIPCPSIALSALPRDCLGKIALLDTASETLFVSPDIITVNKYTSLLKSGSAPKELDLTLSDGKSIAVLPRVSSASKISNKGHGYLLELPRPTGGELICEDVLYEGYRDAAEAAMGLSVTVLTDTDIYLTDRLRAIMRASVFGDISLLLRGILTEHELISALETFCKVFCELEIECREFNGYVQRGLLVDTPYMLGCAGRVSGVDFITYDAERLSRLMSGEKRAVPREILQCVSKNICQTVGGRRELSHRVLLGRATASPDLCRSLLECGITKYFVPEDMTNSFRELFYGIIHG